MGGQDQRRRLIAAVYGALAEVVPSRAAVVLAVSGGADSVALAWLVTAARPDLRATVVHVRHGLRDDEADARAAAAHAAALGLPCRSVAVDVQRDGRGVEAAARDARYQALAVAAGEQSARFVLTGHTADDQAETVLLNLARGSGLRGVAGMPATRPLSQQPAVTLTRPLLTLRRAAVRAVATATGLPLAEDPTNADPAQRRARARHTLLPLLAELTGGGTDPVEALTRLAEHARSDADALDALAASKAAMLIRRWGPVRVVRRPALDALPRALSTRLVRLLLADAGATRASGATVDAVLGLRAGQAIDLPGGGSANTAGGWLATAPPSLAPLVQRPVRDGVELPEIGLRLRLDGAGDAVLPPWAPARAAGAVRVPAAGLVVRARRRGERIVTAAGSRNLADAMAAARVPRVARCLVPVIADADGPVWVPGVAVRPVLPGDASARWLRLVAAS